MGNTRAASARARWALVLALIALTAFVLVAARAPATAGAQPAPTSSPSAPMAALLADRQPAQNLEPLGSMACTGGSAGGFPCHQIDLLSFLPLSVFDAGEANDIWGWTDPQTGSEYALLGLYDGTAFVDVTDPANPVYLGKLPTHTDPSIWRDIKVHADHAYIVSEASSHGVQVFDLTELRTVGNPPATFSETAHYAGVGSAHNIAINEASGYAYVVGASSCSGGLHMIDLSTPASPAFAGCFSADGYTHDSQCVDYAGPDPDYQGAEVCFNANEDTLTIVDITDKSNPIQISRNPYVGVGYTHQGWLTADHRYFLLDDETDEFQGHNTRTYIWDVAALDAPALVDQYDGPTPAIDHNLYIHQGFVYEANYRSGLRVLATGDLGQGDLSEIGYFDVYPANDDLGYNGAWSVYPFFESGTVVVSGIEQGLFAVRSPYVENHFQVAWSEPTATFCGAGSQAGTVTLQSNTGFTGTVALQTTGLPGGAAASFGDNPLSVPGTTPMTVTVDGSAIGTFPLQLVGTNGVVTQTLAGGLSAYVSPPGQPTLLDPATGAQGVDIFPTLAWETSPDVMTYTLEIATDPGFANPVYTATTATGAYTLTAPLEASADYFWRVQGHNGCGAGPASPAATFSTRRVPPILLVADDKTETDVLGYYTATLTALAADHDVWQVDNSAPESAYEPDGAHLSPYDLVVWFTGDLWFGVGPDSDAEEALAGYLDGGGCLFMSSQNYYSARGLTGFLRNYLGVQSGVQNARYDTVTATGGPFAGLGQHELDFPFTNLTDGLTPDGSAALVFAGSGGLMDADAGVVKETAAYQATLWGFPFEALPGETVREAAMLAVINWCEVPLIIPSIAPYEPKAGVMGTTVVHPLTWTNLGNVTDFYTLTLSTDAPWPATLSAARVGPIAPGASQAVTLTVSVPTNIADGDQMTGTITATSHIDPSVSIQVPVETIGWWHRSYLPVILPSTSAGP